MGIELRITSSSTEGESTTSIEQINESDITVGCYNDDSVKLESQLLQGCHVRIGREYNTDTDEKRFIIKNISGEKSIFLNNEPLESDEYQPIEETTEIRLGQYTLYVRDFRESDLTSPDMVASSFDLESFSPNKFSLDSAMQTLLRPDEQIQVPENKIEETQNSSIVEAPMTDVSSAETIDTETSESITTEIPTLQMAGQSSQARDTENVVTLPQENTHVQQDVDVTVESTDKQTLFEGVVGSEDIFDLNFNAYRLYSISGRVIHHNQPLAGVVLDGGPLGVTQTDTNGNFSFENIVEGTNYQINVSCKGYMLSKTQVLFGTINDNIKHDLSAIKLSRVTGRIVHDGTPLPSVTLDAGPYGICLTDVNGYYHFDNVPENTDMEIHALGAGFMFKRTGTATGVNGASTGSSAAVKTGNTTYYSEKEMEDSLAALVGRRQNVA